VRKFLYILIFLIHLQLISAIKYDDGLALIYKKGLVNIDNQDVRLAAELLLKEMIVKDERQIKIDFSDDIEKIILSFQEAKADILSLSFIYYLQEYNRISPHVKDAWILIARKNDTFRRFFLVVNKKSEISSLKELKNKRIGLLELDSIQELYIDGLLLEKEGMQSQEFFREKVYYPKFSRGLLKLFFNKIDACIVSEYAWDIAVELNPQIKDKLKIIDKSADIFPPVSLILTHKKSSYYTKLYENFALGLDENSRATQIFNMYQIVQSIKVSENDLIPIREYYKHYLKLKKDKSNNAK